MAENNNAPADGTREPSGEISPPADDARRARPLESLLILAAALTLPLSDWLPAGLSLIHLGPPNAAGPWLGGVMLFTALKAVCRTYDLVTEIVKGETRSTNPETVRENAADGPEDDNASETRIRVYVHGGVEVHITLTDEGSQKVLLKLEPETAKALATNIAKAAEIAENGAGSATSRSMKPHPNEGTAQ